MLFRPGEEKSVHFFVPPEVGLTVLSEEPLVQPKCLVSGDMNIQQGVSVEIDVPFCVTFRASFVCLSGAVAVRQNYPDVLAVSITPDIEYEIHYSRADVEKFILTGAADAHVVYDIERVM
jgi:hypothetical protein